VYQRLFEGVMERNDNGGSSMASRCSDRIMNAVCVALGKQAE
jgi:hypothetical protein